MNAGRMAEFGTEKESVVFLGNDMRQVSLNEMLRSLHDALPVLKMEEWERDQIRISFSISTGGRDTGLLNDKQVEFIETQYHKHK